eukprot:gi/632962105/ref/XP_007897126.1/ PREDICTED: follistatin-related protein 3 [Callorhinchus milii]
MPSLSQQLLLPPLTLAVVCLLLGGKPAYAGVCWLQQGRNGKCQALSMTRIIREECCGSGNAQAAWTSQDIPEGEILKLIILGGVGCHPCHSEYLTSKRQLE